jgi:predicted dehydrogenase
MSMEKTVLGIIGCGVISNTYIKDIQRLYFSSLFIKAVADSDLNRAKEQAKKYGISCACSVEEILADPEIAIIINLTPPKFHTQINRMIIGAGKNLFCEKPFALTLEDAEEIREAADTKGVYAACAPDSFLGSSLRTCRKLLEDGWIGKPLYVNANMMNCGVETWHVSPFSFYGEGGGPIFDMGGYYFTALVDFFGSAESVIAVSGKGFNPRKCYAGPHTGEDIEVEVPTFYSAILRMTNGIIVTMNFSFDIWKSSLPVFEIYGTDGTLKVPDPNMHGGVPEIYRKEQKLAACFGGNDTGNGEMFRVPEIEQDVGEYVRGMGVSDLAEAIKSRRECKCNARLAVHVVDIMTGIIKAADSGKTYFFTTSYEKSQK